LERVAGIPAEKIVEAHGTFFTAHCLKCRKEYDLEFVKG
jgi:NAD-dependent SIR2 family protein deacetylase